ncbi:MAG: (4Fe-4S)-binding protein, partial [Thermoanaerobacterales bacterium]|nr:(4Fe-4S)-binding protein [Thermoanaerobacterales bacterium]
IHGVLEVGSVLAPPVIKKVKSLFQKDAAVIIDARPGTSCPMISAVAGADFCIMVTEPTPFGLNDLRLAVDVARELKLPFGVIINRAGIGDADIDSYLLAENIPLLMKIPFDRRYATCYAEGNLLVEEFEDLKESLKGVWETVERRVEQ